LKFKLYRFSADDNRDKKIGVDRVVDIFKRSVGRDSSGEFTKYRGKKDAVLMYLRTYKSDFTGLIGRFSSERLVSFYNDNNDEVVSESVADDDYPHVPFICFPRLGCLLCADKAVMRADAAVSRLHQILAHRTQSFFVFDAFSESVDLRVAVKKFNVYEVNFEIYPVNPHTGDLGAALDNSRKKDFINSIKGKMVAKQNSKMQLNGGLLTSIQQLQQSGHAKTGFKARTEDGVEIDAPKQINRRKLHEVDDDLDESLEDSVSIRINVNDDDKYPFDLAYIIKMRSIVRKILDHPDE